MGELKAGLPSLFCNVSQSTMCSSRRRTIASRIILGLTLLLLLVMPVTERFATWDDFGNGGQDLELTLLSGLAVCGLVALLADQAIGDPVVSALLGHRPPRPRVRSMLLTWLLGADEFVVSSPPTRSVDRSVPLSRLFLRI